MKNHLIKLIASTTDGPEKEILSYLDEQDQANFFMVAKYFKQYQKYTYDSRVDDFIRHLQAELKRPHNHTWWSHRHFPTITYRKWLCIVLAILLAITVLFITEENLRKHEQILYTKQQLSKMIYSLNPQVFCNILLDPNNANVCLETFDWGNGQEACERLSRLNFTKALVQQIGYSTAALALLIGLQPKIIGMLIINFIYFITQPTTILKTAIEGNSRLPLTVFSVALQREAKKLFTELRERSNIKNFSSTTASSARTVLTELKANNRLCQETGQAFRFFRKVPRIANNAFSTSEENKKIAFPGSSQCTNSEMRNNKLYLSN